jgi:hypothetical protein
MLAVAVRRLIAATTDRNGVTVAEYAFLAVVLAAAVGVTVVSLGPVLIARFIPS